MSISQYIIIGIMILAGIFVVVSPILKCANSKVSKVSGSNDFQELKRQRKMEDTDSGEDSRFVQLRKIVEEYNRKLFKTKQKDFTGTFPTPKGDYLTLQLDEDEPINIFAMLTIKSKRPTRIRKKSKEQRDKHFNVYLTPTRSTLTNNFVIVNNTSMPIGGANTACVLYGKPKRDLGLDGKFDIRMGDIIKTENLWETLSYSVNDLCVMKKDDKGNILKIVKGKDNLILVIDDGRKKYCIFAERVILPEDKDDKEEDVDMDELFEQTVFAK